MLFNLNKSSAHRIPRAGEADPSRSFPLSCASGSASPSSKASFRVMSTYPMTARQRCVRKCRSRTNDFWHRLQWYLPSVSIQKYQHKHYINRYSDTCINVAAKLHILNLLTTSVNYRCTRNLWSLSDRCQSSGGRSHVRGRGCQIQLNIVVDEHLSSVA